MNYASLPLLFFLSFQSHAAHFNVFFAGGQSNAKPIWADSIEQSLTDSGVENVLMVHNFHSGNWLDKWWNSLTDTPNENYESDFFNSSGTGALQQALDSLSGMTYSFSGFFWFQGEGDASSEKHRLRYMDEFTDMLDRLQFDLTGEAERDFPVIMALVDARDMDEYQEIIGAKHPDADIEELRAVVSGYLDPMITVVDSRGYERRDVFHLTNAALEDFGASMAVAYIPIPPTLLLIVSAIGTLGLFHFNMFSTNVWRTHSADR